MRKLFAALALAGGLAMQTGSVAAHGDAPDWFDELMHTAADYRGASYWQMYNIMRCETGGWDERVILGNKHGAAGEIGPAQILPSWTAAARAYGSIGALFEARDGDYYSPSDQAYFLAWALTHGLRWHWHCG